jgi:cobalt-zinc-cadmium efflux system outer membrane protein
MRLRFVGASAWLLAVALAGCDAPKWGAPPPERHPPGERGEAPRPPVRPEAGETALTRKPAELKEPTGELTLRNALALALARSPELKGFAWGVRQAEAERLQAGLLPNPEIETEWENFAGSGDFRGTRALETTLTLSQLVELGGKREKRIRLAEQDRQLAAWDYEAKRLAVLTAVAKQFIDVLAMQGKLALAREDLRLAEATLDGVRTRVEEGEAAPTEKLKATIEAATGRIRVGRIERAVTAGRHKLAGMWGGRGAKFDCLAGKLEDVAPLPAIEALFAKLAGHPQLARWATELDQRRAALAVERAKVVPDVTVGVGYRHFRETEDNDRAMLVSVALPLPVFDRNQGAVSKAQFGILKARAEREAAEVQARADLEAAYQGLAAAHAEAVALRDEILPAARDSFKAAKKSLREGKTGYLDLLEAQRTLIEAREQHIEALGSYHQAVAKVEGLIGQNIESDKIEN